jgi:hypothetical protein
MALPKFRNNKKLKRAIGFPDGKRPPLRQVLAVGRLRGNI